MKWVLLLLMGAALSAAAADLGTQVDGYRQGHEAVLLERLATFAQIQSVAANPRGLAAAAQYLSQELTARGFEVRLLNVPGGSAPVVFGELKGTHAKRTVVYYAHYDGQPVTPSQWSSDAFTPTLRQGAALTDTIIDWHTVKPPIDPEWRLFARAVSDDKASIAAFLGAFDALKSLHRAPSVNVKVLWEGEEEAGSTHLRDILEANQALLKADLFLIGDGPVHQSRRPLVYFGARGTTSVEMTLYGPNRALHDGHYGNWAVNPAAAAANLLAQMRDADGHILIPGFGDDVRPLSDAEREALKQLPSMDAALRREFGLPRSEGNESLAESLMRPALNIRGIKSGQVGAEAANAIPVDAEVSIDFRLVPNQTPAGVRAKLEGFLKDRGFTLVNETPDAAMRLAHPLVKLVWEKGYPPLRSDMNSAPAKAVSAAVSQAARQPVLVAPTLGGSVPIYMFEDLFHVPIVGLPIVNHDNNQHAANENLRLKNYWDGIDTYAALLAELHW
jgi:acetylornithine deacetylase/succinyl-diaminopimelate desuccinylase-like protein